MPEAAERAWFIGEEGSVVMSMQIVLRSVFAFAAAVVFFTALPAMAASPPVKHKGANADPAKRGSSPRTDGVGQAALADQLARHADRARDVLAMIAAARMLGQVSPRLVKHEIRTEGVAKPAAKSAAGASRDTSVAGLLARARQYAGGRHDLNQLIEEVARTVAKGRKDGPARAVNSLAVGIADVHTVQFNANEPVMVALTGDGETDLDLAVEDEKGNRICASNSAVDVEICSWTPKWTGAFRIRVHNVGPRASEYRLWSN